MSLVPTFTFFVCRLAIRFCYSRISGCDILMTLAINFNLWFIEIYNSSSYDVLHCDMKHVYHKWTRIS
jgi:hypothetical protein